MAEQSENLFDEQDFHIDPDELRRLVVEGQAQADRGELIPGEEVFREIREESARRREKRA